MYKSYYSLAAATARGTVDRFAATTFLSLSLVENNELPIRSACTACQANNADHALHGIKEAEFMIHSLDPMLSG